MENTHTYTITLTEGQNTNLVGLAEELGMKAEEMLLESHLVGLNKMVVDTFGPSPLDEEEEYEDEESMIEDAILEKLAAEREERERIEALDPEPAIDPRDLTTYSQKELERLFAWFVKDNYNPYAPTHNSFDEFCAQNRAHVKRYDENQNEIPSCTPYIPKPPYLGPIDYDPSQFPDQSYLDDPNYDPRPDACHIHPSGLPFPDA